MEQQTTFVQLNTMIVRFVYTTANFLENPCHLKEVYELCNNYMQENGWQVLKDGLASCDLYCLLWNSLLHGL